MWSAGLLEPLPTAEWLVWTQSASSEHPVSGSPQSCAGSTTQNQQPVPRQGNPHKQGKNRGVNVDNGQDD